MFEIRGHRIYQTEVTENPKKFYHIYAIRNKVNDKVYIGSSSISILDRWSNHIKQLQQNKHHSIKLQRAWNKYGQDSFEFEIIEALSHKDGLIAAEQDYIDMCDSYRKGYNCCPIAGSIMGYKHTAKSKALMSKNNKGRVSNRKGVKLSDETKQKLRLANLGVKRPEWVCALFRGRTFSMSDVAKQKISIANGQKNFYTILFRDGSIIELNFFRDYCLENNINFKILHGWSKFHRSGAETHPIFGIKILSLTVKK